MSYGFVANFMRFPAVQYFWQSANIWQSYREFEGGNFFLRHIVVRVYWLWWCKVHHYNYNHNDDCDVDCDRVNWRIIDVVQPWRLCWTAVGKQRFVNTTTLWVKKWATLTIAITLSILGRFAKFFCCCKERWISNKNQKICTFRARETCCKCYCTFYHLSNRYLSNVMKIRAKINTVQNINILLFVHSLSLASLKLCS